MTMLENPLIWRGVERIIIMIGAISFGYFGYKLYEIGIGKGHSNLEIRSSFLKFVLSGAGPGIVFLAFGATVLVSGLFSGGAGTENEKEKKWLYTGNSNACERLVGSPDDLLPGALKSSSLPWAPPLAKEITDQTKLRRIVEEICKDSKKTSSQ